MISMTKMAWKNIEIVLNVLENDLDIENLFEFILAKVRDGIVDTIALFDTI